VNFEKPVEVLRLLAAKTLPWIDGHSPREPSGSSGGFAPPKTALIE
jgi:hypothetical protein